MNHSAIDRRLAQEYPQIEGLRITEGRITDDKGRPAELDGALRKQAEADYDFWLEEAHQDAAEPVVAFLQARGYKATVFDLFPAVTVELSKATLLELNEASLPNLGSIQWGGIEFTPQLDSAAYTIRAPSIWEHGYTGAGAINPVTVAVVEAGPIELDVTHGALQGKIVAVNAEGATDPHAAAVAGVTVGDHPSFPEYRGIAYGNSRVVSVDVDNSWQSFEEGLNFAVNHGAHVINLSLSTAATREMRPEDRVLDYVARHSAATIVVAAGNEHGTGDWSVRSPAKGYNILTVGGFADHNTTLWADDNMWPTSCWEDPFIDGSNISGDREKPEVVAVGAEVTTADTLEGDDGFDTFYGTSVAAPQVAGLATLLVDRVPLLAAWPEGMRAIIMASAMHNIQGNNHLSEADGTGGVDASSAYDTVDGGQWAVRTITHPADYYTETWQLKEAFSFSASAGDRVRAVIAWDSNPITYFQTSGTDSLNTDLDFHVYDPDFEYVDGASSFNNSFEILEFSANKTGEYTIEVIRYEPTSSETHNYLGVAWATRPVRYLPIVLKSYTSGALGAPLPSPTETPVSPYPQPSIYPSPVYPPPSQ